MEQPTLILASSSPRRKELLAGLNVPFVTHPSSADEDVPAGTSPHDIVEMLALRKANAVAGQHERGLVIGSDTIVVLHGEVFGKPRDDDEAADMLSKLQNQAHTVFSGVAIVDAGSGRSLIRHNRTEVHIKPLSAEQIRRYVATGEPADKAGAYAIQGIGATIVERIAGDYFTVVGLPMSLLSDMLREFGIEVP